MSNVTDPFFTVEDRSSVQTDSPVPLYFQLYRFLKRRILSGTFGFGTVFPSEARLAKEFGVSRITTKRAMDLLAAEELIDRKRGKGSQVLFMATRSNVDVSLIGMFEKLVGMSKSTAIKVLRTESIVPPNEILAELQLDVPETVSFVVRVRFDSDGRPFAYYESWTRGMDNGFAAADLRQRQRIEIMAECGADIGRMEQKLSAAAASPDVADHLQLLPGDPVLTLARRSFNENGDVIDLLNCQYHPGRFQYHMNLADERKGE